MTSWRAQRPDLPQLTVEPCCVEARWNRLMAVIDPGETLLVPDSGRVASAARRSLLVAARGGRKWRGCAPVAVPRWLPASQPTFDIRTRARTAHAMTAINKIPAKSNINQIQAREARSPALTPRESVSSRSDA